MKKNVGVIDRNIRYILALIFIVLALTTSPWFWLLAAVAAGTAFFQVCGLYKVLGISTNEKNK